MIRSNATFWIPLSVFGLLCACGPDSPAGGDHATTGGEDDPATGGTGSGGTPELLCPQGQPLQGGAAAWEPPPYEPPAAGDPKPDGDDSGGTSGFGFIDDPDGGGTSLECSVWDQDCDAGEKCSPWANDGGTQHNALKCAPVAPDPAQPGDACSVEGSPYSGIDDCDVGVTCWEVEEAILEGTCVAMCQGSEVDPQCARGEFCWIGNNGVTPLCLPDNLCADDGACRCMCPEGSDPDCAPDQCTCIADEVCNCDCGAGVDPDCGQDECPDGGASIEPLDLRTQPISEAVVCPDTQDPVVLYMSNDDSNSQASPVLARRFIEEGRVMPPDRVRIHEFLNYYDLGGDHPTDAPAKVGIQMRRTAPDSGEFTLVLTAASREMTTADRPPLNLVFSLDTSGSMSGEPIGLLKESMVAAAGQLREGDVVSMVTWSTVQDVPLQGYVVSGPDDPELLAVIESLDANGGTDLHAGLQLGYELANTYHLDHGINRVVLISDGGANAGITDIDLIASEAQDNDGEGTYLVGVGVGTSSGYNDNLMDEVTDAGKGAYVFIDGPEEAHRMLGQHFLSNVAVVARNVQMKLTLPWYFGIKSFHGEEYSPDPTEVEPQHLGPNDVMTFHQIIAACDPSAIADCDSVQARVDYTDPVTGEAGSDEVTVPIEDVVVDDAEMLYKADVIVGYAKALIVIGTLHGDGQTEQALAVAQSMATWTQAAADTLADPELGEIASTMAQYVSVLQ